MVLFCRGRWCNIDNFHRSGVPPFSCGCYRTSLLSVRLAEKNLYFAHVLRSEDVRIHYRMLFLNTPPLCQERDPFGYHHGVRDCLASCLRELSPLFQLINQSSKGFRGVVGPHYIDCVILEIDFVDHPVARENIL